MSRSRMQPRVPGVLLRRLVVGLLSLLALTVSSAPARADATVAFTITDPRITASSGLTRDPDHGVYWTINDLGGPGRVYALDSAGHVTGTVNFRADLTDLEALQYFDGALYIGDIGDNQEQRPFVTVYLLYDTVPNDGTVLYRAYDFAYPDGPHDAETLLINRSGRIFLVTKGKDGGIYQAPADPSRTGVNTLTRIADAPADVTDGQFLADGRIALRTYTAVQILDPDRDFRVVARAATPAQPLGESLTQNLAGDGLLVGSEGRSSAVYAMPVPGGLGTFPTTGASPSTRSTASAGPTASTGGGDNAGTPDGTAAGAGADGTRMALLAAAAVALLAGLLVYLLSGRGGDDDRDPAS